MIRFHFNYWIFQFHHISFFFLFLQLKESYHNSNFSLFSQPDLKQIALCTTVVLNVLKVLKIVNYMKYSNSLSLNDAISQLQLELPGLI